MTNDATPKARPIPPVPCQAMRQDWPTPNDQSGNRGSIRLVHEYGLEGEPPENLEVCVGGDGEQVYGNLRSGARKDPATARVRQEGGIQPPKEKQTLLGKAAIKVHKLKAPRDKSNTLHTRIGEYLQFVAMTCSHNTLLKYRGIIRKFEGFVAENNIREIGAQAVLKYFLHLTSGGRTKKYIHTTRQTLSLMFSWLVRMGYMDSNPALAIPERAVKEPPKTPVAVTDREYEALRIGSIGTELHYAIICAWHTGMRISDICALKWCDVDLDNRIISVSPIKTRGRSRKRAIIPIHPELMETLVSRHAVRLPTESFVSEYLASKYQNRPDDIFKGLKKIADRAGVVVTGFHSFRHAAIRRWLESPVADAVTVMSMSGHASVSSLERYSDPSIAKKLAIMGLHNDVSGPVGRVGAEDRHGAEDQGRVRPQIPIVAQAPGADRARARADDDEVREGEGADQQAQERRE